MEEVKFAIINTRSQFEDKLQMNEIDNNFIVFIKDTNEIWAQGDYYSKSHIVLSQEEYNDRLANGQIYDNVFYYIK